MFKICLYLCSTNSILWVKRYIQKNETFVFHAVYVKKIKSNPINKKKIWGQTRVSDTLNYVNKR